VNKTVKHHWYGETSPSAEQQLEDYYGIRRPPSRPAASKMVILDRENPLQLRSGDDHEIGPHN